MEREGLGRFMWHANQILEVIDGILEGEGGLLGALPPEGERELAEESLLGQWLAYTQNLVLRVAELEREVVGLRELCKGGMGVPGVACTPSSGTRNGDTRKGKGREKGGENSQEGWTDRRPKSSRKERYILAGLTPSLWTRLQSALSASEQISISREQRAYRRGFTAQGLLESLHSPHPNSDSESANGVEPRDDSWVPDNIVAWIECSSRVYRCQGMRRGCLWCLLGMLGLGWRW